MNTLTLQWAITFQWNDAGNTKTKQVSKQQVTKHNGTIIIGRDERVCDIVLNNPDVSKEGVNIYCDEQAGIFFINNVGATHTPNVDGQYLAYGNKLPLKVNSNILLGTQKIEVTDIQIYQLSSTNYSGLASSSSNSKNINPITPITPSQVPASANGNLITPTPNTSSKDDKSPSWQDKTIIAAILAATASIIAGAIAAGVNIYASDNTRTTETHKAEAVRQTEKERLELESRNAKEKLYLERYIAHREKVRELREKNPAYNKLLLKNECSEPVYVAASFIALDDVLQTRGWLVLQPNNGQSSPGYLTISDGIFLHATITKGDQEIKWEGDKTSTIQRFVPQEEFDYIEEPFLDPNEKSKPTREVFYKVKFDFPPTTEDKYTTKTFKCNGYSLQLN
jgi:FHA domain